LLTPAVGATMTFRTVLPTFSLRAPRRARPLAVAVLVLTSFALQPARSDAASPALYNPPANIVPSPPLLSSGTCTRVGGAYSCANPCIGPHMTWPVFTSSTRCTNYVTRAINNARAREGVAPMILPTNWNALSVPEQLFVVANLERVARGFPPYLGLNQALSAEAQRAANAQSDPGVAPGFNPASNPSGGPAIAGVWAGGGYNVLFASYYWMYADAWGGSTALTANIACTSPGAAGCWAHRDQLLGSDPALNATVGLHCTICEMGTASAVVNGSQSYADLIERPAGAPPAMTFTWAQELVYFAGATSPSTPRRPRGAPTPSLGHPSLSALSIAPSLVRLRWSAAGAHRITRVTITLFQVNTCSAQTRLRSTSVALDPRRRAHSGVVELTSTSSFDPAQTYWGVVSVHAAHYARHSACTALRGR